MVKEIDASLEGPIKPSDLRNLHEVAIDKLSLTKQPLLTVALAREFDKFKSVREFFLWCSVTRTAMRHVIKISGLEELNILALQHPGQLEGFENNQSLKTFRCNFLSERDLLEVLKLPKLQKVGAQDSDVTSMVIDAIVASSIQGLDIESADLDSDMVANLATSSTIQKLDIGNVGLDAAGLARVCKMSQLRELDIFANNITEADLDLLQALPHLEYISVGGFDGQNTLTSSGVLPRLRNLKSLKRIWLDQVFVSDSDLAELREQYDHVIYTFTDE